MDLSVFAAAIFHMVFGIVAIIVTDGPESPCCFDVFETLVFRDRDRILFDLQNFFLVDLHLWSLQLDHQMS